MSDIPPWPSMGIVSCNQTMAEKKTKNSPEEHGWCLQEDHSVLWDRLQQPLLNQDQLVMSLPGDDDIIDASEYDNDKVEDVKDNFSFFAETRQN